MGKVQPEETSFNVDKHTAIDTEKKNKGQPT